MTMFNIIQRGERADIFLENIRVGYVENDVLYGMDRKGYAVEICVITHKSDINGKLTEWRKVR